MGRSSVSPRLTLLALGSALALAGGCAMQPGAAPPVATAQFDGDYTGDSSLVRGFGFLCGAPTQPMSMSVRVGQFGYPFAVDPPRMALVPVQIATDGSFSAQMQYGTEDQTPRSLHLTEWVTVAGQISGSALHATVTDYRCTRQLELAKR